MDNDNKEEAKIIKELEQHLDKIVEEEIVIVQIDDADYAEQLGLTDPPTLVQFSGDVPNLYSGAETAEAIIKWLAMLKEEAVIEAVTEEILADLIDNNPEDKQTVKRMVALYRDMQMHNEAIALLNKFLEANQGDTESWAELADIYLCRQNYAKAIFCYEELVML